jgi:hypothetical protein
VNVLLTPGNLAFIIGALAAGSAAGLAVCWPVIRAARNETRRRDR